MTVLSTQLDRRLAQLVHTTGALRQRCAQEPAVAPAARGIDWFSRALFHVWRNRRYLTPLKLANIALVNAQFALKTERVLGRPYKMKIESTNICNTHCQLCPTGIGRPGRAKGAMTLDRYKALIDRFRWHLVALDLSMWGDPLIVPDIYEMIRYAHDRRIWTYISSNLHAYRLPHQRRRAKPGRPTQAERLVESGLDLMTCSLHGASQETYEIYQPGKSFHDAIEKIREIVATRQRLGSRTPQIQLNFVVMRQNEHEVDAFRRLAEDLGCKPVFSMPSMNARFIDEDGPDANHAPHYVSLGLAEDVRAKQSPEQRKRELLERWLPKNPEYRLSSYDQMINGDYRGEQYNGRKVHFCDWLWRQAVINWDGQVSTCCGSFNPGEDMGDVFERGFGAIWNSRKYRLARRSFKRPLTPEQSEGNGCATCPGFMV